MIETITILVIGFFLGALWQAEKKDKIAKELRWERLKKYDKEDK